MLDTICNIYKYTLNKTCEIFSYYLSDYHIASDFMSYFHFVKWVFVI